MLEVDLTRLKYAPVLAESLPTTHLIGDSLTELRYTLRAAAAWDNGCPVLASDVAFTLKLMFCPDLPNEAARARFGFIEDITTTATAPRRFTLVCRGQSLEYLVASGDFPILSEAAIDPRGQLRRYSLRALQRRPVTAPADTVLLDVARRYRAASPDQLPGLLPGCGPYELVAWERDRYLTLRRKTNWWPDAQLQPVPAVLQALPKQLEYVIIPDAATATLALRRGDLDVYPQMPAREYARLQTSPSTSNPLRLYSSLSYSVVMAGFNTRQPVLADALTRQALSHCFDAAGLLEATQMGAGTRTVGILSPANRINYNDSLALIPFDLKRAAALLRQAGWQRGPEADAGWVRAVANRPRQQLALRVRYRAEETLFATVALQFQAAAAKIGVPVTLLPTESGTFSSSVHTGDFDVYVRMLNGNPFMFNFTPIFHSEAIGAGNTTGFDTPASDHLIEAITTAETEQRRAHLLRRFQALMQREMPVVPLFFLPNRVAASSSLTGLQVSSLKPGYAVKTLVRAPQPSPAP
ncbi:ABC transporter substrate-binding protein [Hymenobacter glacialis]|uniref:Solute-binding protein family 5 domain-containing protein n=1 Tax=Hymenobacter glacialis TaxID=1908236 RepID=A0A1G1ST88_9BACT|nr:ABC transporter substrate-binding protein [Hymenobacter glacialis]OGX81824.1 hypothetical protein BEN48_06245 [Hymenobacter glacialis]